MTSTSPINLPSAAVPVSVDCPPRVGGRGVSLLEDMWSVWRPSRKAPRAGRSEPQPKPVVVRERFLRQWLSQSAPKATGEPEGESNSKVTSHPERCMLEKASPIAPNQLFNDLLSEPPSPSQSSPLKWSWPRRSHPAGAPGTRTPDPVRTRPIIAPPLPACSAFTISGVPMTISA